MQTVLEIPYITIFPVGLLTNGIVKNPPWTQRVIWGNFTFYIVNHI